MNTGAWYTGPPIPTLTAKELKPIREKMKADGFKMPRVGWCVRMSNGQEICQDNRRLALTNPQGVGVGTPLWCESEKGGVGYWLIGG